MSAKLFGSIQDLAKSGFIFRIQDSGPVTIDRMTVLFCDGDYLALSYNGVGFSQWGEGMDAMTMADHAEEGTAVDLALGDLLPELQNHILYRVNESWEDFLEKVLRRDPDAVAPNRDAAKIHDGIFSSGGEGIYFKDGEYYIRMEGDESEDRGPFATAQEAIVNTLPDDYSLCGEEYHPEHDVSSLEPTPGVQDRVAALEHQAELALYMHEPSHRFFGLIETDGVANGVSSKDPILYTPTQGVTFTQTDLADWQQMNNVWYCRKQDDIEVHVLKVDTKFFVSIEGNDVAEQKPRQYDTFIEAIVRGQIEFDKFTSARAALNA